MDPVADDRDEPRKAARGSIAAKIALAGIAGALVALFVVQQPLTQPLPNTLQIADMTWVEVRSAIAPRLYAGDRAERRHRAERRAHGARQARLHRRLVGQRDRQATRADPGDAGDPFRAGGRLRSADRAPAFPRHHRHFRRGLWIDARGDRPQSQGRRLQDDLSHRRPRREPQSPDRGGQAPDPGMGGPGRAGARRVGLLRRCRGDRIPQEPRRDRGSDRPARRHRRYLGADVGASRRRRSHPHPAVRHGADRRVGQSAKSTRERGRSLLNIKIFGAIRQIKALEGGI